MSENTPPPANPYQSVQPLSPSDEKLWATLIHIGGIFFHFLPSLIGYLVLKDRGAFIREHGRAALNFQLTLLLAYVVGFFTIWFVIGFFVLLAAGAVNIIFSIIATLAANRGENYRYPVAIEFVKA